MDGKTSIAVALVVLLALLLMLPAGCGGGDEGAISEVVLGSLALQDSFALYYPVPATTTPRVPAYTVNPGLSNVVGADGVNMPPGVASTLALQGFAAVAGASDNIYQVYQDNAGAKFVTVDALLQTFHLLYTYALRDAEEGSLAADLKALVASLYDTVERMYRGSEGTVREAALSDLAYLGVAARLLSVETALPPEVADMVGEELVLIAGHTGTAVSPIFKSQEYYSSYEPRGYYADGGELAGYFQAMTWLGRMGFYPSPGMGPGDIVAGRDMTRQALILVGALHMAEVDGKPAYAVWDRIYQPNSFLAGYAEDLNAYIYTRLARELFGQSFPLSRLEDDALLDEFITRAVAEQPARIVPVAGTAERVDESSMSFRLFGQPGFPDDYIFQELVAPEVPDRFMPRGLDVPAALGSDRAVQILDQVYGENGYEGYKENMEALRALLKNVDPIQAHSNTYWSCLDIQRLMLKPCGEGYPSFMRAAAWRDRGLYDFLGSWAEMRHYEVDYTGQGAVASPGAPAGTEQGYVEPCPEAFARLAATTDVIRRGMDERGLASAPLQERLNELYELLLALKTMAEKELRNETLSAEEYAAIASIGETMRYLVTFPSQEGGEQAFETDAYMPLVDSVYGDPNYGETLQVAVGRPVTYYVVAPVAGRPTLTVGAGYSYYEFVKPTDGLLTDEAWQETVSAGQLPETPAWTASFLQ